MSITDRFAIVGVGASAGGVEALEGFFRGLPAEPGFAIVVVTHLSPERESLLHEEPRFDEDGVPCRIALPLPERHEEAGGALQGAE